MRSYREELAEHLHVQAAMIPGNKNARVDVGTTQRGGLALVTVHRPRPIRQHPDHSKVRKLGLKRIL